MQTYTTEVHLNSDSIDNVDFAIFSVSREDVERWLNLLAIGKANDLAYLEAWDYRCEFLIDPEGDGEEADLVPSDFRQDTSRFVIMASQDAVRFTGYARHGGTETEWNTEPLKLKDLAKDFGLYWREG